MTVARRVLGREKPVPGVSRWPRYPGGYVDVDNELNSGVIVYVFPELAGGAPECRAQGQRIREPLKTCAAGGSMRRAVFRPTPA